MGFNENVAMTFLHKKLMLKNYNLEEAARGHDDLRSKRSKMENWRSAFTPRTGLRRRFSEEALNVQGVGDVPSHNS